jgi:putative phosphoribosyl transferase
MLFRDRTHAGRELARELERYRGDRPIVVGLPRGGMPVAYEVARALGAPLDVWIVRKVGAPLQPELGIGAVAEGGELYVDPRIAAAVGETEEHLQRVVDEKLREVERRVRLFRGDRPRPDVRGRTVLVIDDGIATGGTARVAVRSIKRAGAGRVVLATPVGAAPTLAELRDEADEIVVLYAPYDLVAIGEHYIDFVQTSDQEVIDLLAAAQRQSGAPSSIESPAASRLRSKPVERDVEVVAGDERLRGTLAIPPDAVGLVLFAHGSGSSRNSPRNRSVAKVLRRHGVATLLFDLLTPDEEAAEELTRHLRFDIDLLSERLVGATDWAHSHEDLRELPIGMFGASTGAAAALVAAAERPEVVQAVVSRGGRPDLAAARLSLVRAPTLLIVGSLDTEVLELNEAAYRRLHTVKELAIVPGATHLFEEPGTLEQVSRLAARWFVRHFSPSALRAAG